MTTLYVHGLSISSFICVAMIIMMFIIGAIYHYVVFMPGYNDIMTTEGAIINCTSTKTICNRWICSPICEKTDYDCWYYNCFLIVNNTLLSLPDGKNYSCGDIAPVHYSKDHFNGFTFNMFPKYDLVFIIIMAVIGVIISVIWSISICILYGARPIVERKKLVWPHVITSKETDTCIYLCI